MIKGTFVLTTRGRDSKLDIGQDISIGCPGHSSTMVALHFQESFIFRPLTAGVSVVIDPVAAVTSGKQLPWRICDDSALCSWRPCPLEF